MTRFTPFRVRIYEREKLKVIIILALSDATPSAVAVQSVRLLRYRLLLERENVGSLMS